MPANQRTQGKFGREVLLMAAGAPTRNEDMMIKPEMISKVHSILVGLRIHPLSRSSQILTAAHIRAIETATGAQTGPTHGAGMRKSISVVAKEGGQPSKRYRNR